LNYKKRTRCVGKLCSININSRQTQYRSRVFINAHIIVKSLLIEIILRACHFVKRIHIRRRYRLLTNANKKKKKRRYLYRVKDKYTILLYIYIYDACMVFAVLHSHYIPAHLFFTMSLSARVRIIILCCWHGVWGFQMWRRYIITVVWNALQKRLSQMTIQRRKCRLFDIV